MGGGRNDVHGGAYNKIDVGAVDEVHMFKRASFLLSRVSRRDDIIDARRVGWYISPRYRTGSI